VKVLTASCLHLSLFQAGIGTYFEPGVVSPLFRWGAVVLDQAIAWYLDSHVIDGYKFLMQNFTVGDKVCLFGACGGAGELCHYHLTNVFPKVSRVVPILHVLSLGCFIK
jgi:hypothetical protein